MTCNKPARVCVVETSHCKSSQSVWLGSTDCHMYRLVHCWMFKNELEEMRTWESFKCVCIPGEVTGVALGEATGVTLGDATGVRPGGAPAGGPADQCRACCSPNYTICMTHQILYRAYVIGLLCSSSRQCIDSKPNNDAKSHSTDCQMIRLPLRAYTAVQSQKAINHALSVTYLADPQGVWLQGG